METQRTFNIKYGVEISYGEFIELSIPDKFDFEVLSELKNFKILNVIFKRASRHEGYLELVANQKVGFDASEADFILEGEEIAIQSWEDTFIVLQPAPNLSKIYEKF